VGRAAGDWRRVQSRYLTYLAMAIETEAHAGVAEDIPSSSTGQASLHDQPIAKTCTLLADVSRLAVQTCLELYTLSTAL
jgi:hypothetical protein